MAIKRHSSSSSQIRSTYSFTDVHHFVVSGGSHRFLHVFRLLSSRSWCAGVDSGDGLGETGDLAGNRLNPLRAARSAKDLLALVDHLLGGLAGRVHRTLASGDAGDAGSLGAGNGLGALVDHPGDLGGYVSWLGRRGVCRSIARWRLNETHGWMRVNKTKRARMLLRDIDDHQCHVLCMLNFCPPFPTHLRVKK